MPDFNELTTRARAEIPEDTLVPVGTWLLAIRSAKLYPNQDGKSGRLNISLQALEPGDDVDTSDVDEIGFEGIADIRLPGGMFIDTKADADRAYAFFASAGLDGSDDMALEDCCKAIKGAGLTIHGYVNQESHYRDKTRLVNNVTQFSAE